MTDPPGSDPTDRRDELGDVAHPILEQIAGTLGVVPEQLGGQADLEVLGQHEHPDRGVPLPDLQLGDQLGAYQCAGVVAGVQDQDELVAAEADGEVGGSRDSPQQVSDAPKDVVARGAACDVQTRISGGPGSTRRRSWRSLVSGPRQARAMTPTGMQIDASRRRASSSMAA
ncbi:MAG: hypothetical protein WAL50_09475 [Kineosporiaceae bacterium]